MAITIPNADLIRPTTSPTPALPNVPKIALPLPGPVMISQSGASASKAPLVEYAIDIADGTLNGYYGFCVSSSLPLVPDDIGAGVVRGCIVEGFAGVAPGKDVFLDPTARSGATFSGLTQTIVAGRPRIGVGVSTTKIWFD